MQYATTVARADDTKEQLKACAQIEAADSRLACYEALSRDAVAEDGKAAVETSAPAQTAAAATAATSAPTNAPYKGSNNQVEEHRIAVASCQTNNVYDTYLVFENGEVWKQTSGKRLRDNECNFSATLRKDFFGYKLSIDDGRGSFRVKRIK